MTRDRVGVSTLTDTQREVIDAPPGRMVFLGSAGVGKSPVIAELAAWRIRDGSARADQVLILAT